MTNSIFREGGPNNIKKVDGDKYEMTVKVPTDDDGYVGRECTSDDCSPGYFKIKLGTGITGSQEVAFCPYCRKAEPPEEFLTKSQRDYALKIFKNEAIDGINKLIEKTLGFGGSHKKKIGGDFISVEMSYTPASKKYVGRPLEEELQRDLICPHCGLDHAVFGFARWCPDCGKDIFLSHVGQEIEVVKKMLGAVESRRAQFGPRVAARDIENALEDLVSIFEAVLKIITKQYLIKGGVQEIEIDNTFKKIIRNSFQNVGAAKDIFNKVVGFELFSGMKAAEIDELNVILGKRHPITHNLGVIDRKYLEKARSGELEGREIRIDLNEILKAISYCEFIFNSIYNQIFINDN